MGLLSGPPTRRLRPARRSLVQSDAATVNEYLASLPPERRRAIEAVREVILANLPDGYEEAMNWGMITYQVPLETFPDTYNGKPLMYAALANQKNHMAVYLTAVYAQEERGEPSSRPTGRRARGSTWASRACASRSSRTCRSS